MMPYNFPSFQKLTTFVVGVMPQGGTKFYVDASSTDDYLNVLPATLLVERARLLLKDKKSQWVNLQKISRSQATTMVEATLSADGVLSGTQVTHRKGLIAETTDSIPFTIRGEVSGNKISVCPFYAVPITENPFKAGKRLMPVEFPREELQQITVNITLPEGYDLENTPKPISATTPDKGVNGRYAVSSYGGKAQVQYLFNVNKVAHPNTNYEALRDIYSMFAEYSKTPIVFVKK
jgi:hypothetical protein